MYRIASTFHCAVDVADEAVLTWHSPWQLVPEIPEAIQRKINEARNKLLSVERRADVFEYVMLIDDPNVADLQADLMREFLDSEDDELRFAGVSCLGDLSSAKRDEFEEVARKLHSDAEPNGDVRRAAGAFLRLYFSG